MDNPRTDYGAGYAKDKYEKVYYEKKKYPEKSQKNNDAYEYDEKPEKKKRTKKPKTYGGPKQVNYIIFIKIYNFSQVIEYVVKK